MIIRKVKIDDFLQINELYKELFRDMADLEPKYIREVEQDKRFIEEIIREDFIDMLVAEENNKLLGFIVIEEVKSPGFALYYQRKCAYIMDICVASAARGKGVGTKLINASSEWARERELDYIDINVLDKNIGAKKLYRELGFNGFSESLRKDLTISDMKITHIESRGILFTFKDIGQTTNVYIINTKDRYYIIDTYLGPNPMMQIMKYLKDNYGEKEIIVINTHSHWDHIWGNCYFDSSTQIIGHKSIVDILNRDAINELNRYKQFTRGDIEIRYPNKLFNYDMEFKSDDIYIYHTPGHTKDSISIIDKKDRVLYAGDNLEWPIPYINNNNLDDYIKTLKDYLRLASIDIVLGSHIDIEDRDIIKENRAYLESLKYNIELDIDNEIYNNIHNINKEFLENN